MHSMLSCKNLPKNTKEILSHDITYFTHYGYHYDKVNQNLYFSKETNYQFVLKINIVNNNKLSRIFNSIGSLIRSCINLFTKINPNK